MKIAGVLYLHSFDLCPEYVMLRLASLSTDLFLVLHDVTSPAILRAIETVRQRTGKVRLCHKVTGPWTRTGSLETCIRLMDDVKPDVVLLPDEDEVLPQTFPHHLTRWMAQSERPTMQFWQFQCIGNTRTILAENVCRVNPHMKALKWGPGIDYTGKYAGWCFSSTLYKRRKYHCPHPMRHLAYLTPAQRARRFDPRYPNTTKGQWKWYGKDRATMQYHPRMTWKQWVALAGPYRTREQDEAAE